MAAEDVLCCRFEGESSIAERPGRLLRSSGYVSIHVRTRSFAMFAIGIGPATETSGGAAIRLAVSTRMSSRATRSGEFDAASCQRWATSIVALCSSG